MSYEVIQIAVKNADGVFAPIDQPAEVRDGLALFFESIDISWNITHVRTGFIVVDHIDDEALALEIMTELAKCDWGFGEFGKRPDDMPESATAAYKAALAMRRKEGDHNRGVTRGAIR